MKATSGGKSAWAATVAVEKSDVERGIVWGFVSVADNTDSDGETIPQAELEDAFYRFMEAYYDGQAEVFENHEAEAAAVIVESALIWMAGHLRWWVGVKLRSEELRELARNGEITGFSIGGTAERAEG